MLLHVAVTVFLWNVPVSLFLSRFFPDNSVVTYRAPEKVYELRTLSLNQAFPLLDPDGPGGRPGIGENLPQLPDRGTTRTDPKLKIVSNFPKPDNFEQTILQPESPPDVKIPVHLRLPNVILGTGGSLPRLAQQPQVLQVKSEAPRRPKIADLVVMPPPVSSPMPSLPVESSQLPSLAKQESVRSSSQQTTGSGSGTPGNDGRELTVLGVDPAPAGASVAIPPGQRFGSFSVSAAGSGPGSPGGVTGGSVGGGRPGGGGGGDESTGVGVGGHGGGGTRPSAGAAPISVATEANVPYGVSGVIIPDISSHIFPVLRPPRPYREGIVVTAGPGGGGGLHVYGVLRAGKIYTAYLPMPGRNWILQYCANDNPQAGSASSRSVKIQLVAPVAPPAAEEQFDFRRSDLHMGNAGDLIVLRGRILTDGSVDKLEVLQGIDKVTDEVALATFRKWKFRPATRAGKAVDIEILVGIPASCQGCK